MAIVELIKTSDGPHMITLYAQNVIVLAVVAVAMAELHGSNQLDGNVILHVTTFHRNRIHHSVAVHHCDPNEINIESPNAFLVLH